MSPILRVKARWTGFSGAPGYTVLHFSDFGTNDATQAVNAATKTRAFFAAIGQRLPNSVRINIEPDVELIEETNGQLQNSYPAGAQAEVQGAGGTTFSGPTGAVVNWNTSGVRNGRRVKGKSFIVPLSTTSYGVDGLLLPTARTILLDAAVALANSTGTPDLMVYARPTANQADGAAFVCTGASVPGLAAILRSRRD